MKLVTLNANSYCGKDPMKNLENLIDVIANTDFDVIALQEINQLIDSDEVPLSELDNYIPCQDRVPIKVDNYLYLIEKALEASGQTWYWSWLPVHVGWSKYDEGVGLLTRHPIRKTHAFYVSKSTDYLSIKTRKALGIQCEFNGQREWFYSCHFDKWMDPEDPFDYQWDKFVRKACHTPNNVYVMGDFNNDANIRGEGYDYILQTSELIDTFQAAEYKDNGVTVGDYIAGWTDLDHPKQMRIDYIFTNSTLPVKSSHVIFNGKIYPVVSDHFGLEVDFGEKKKVYKNDSGKILPEFSSTVVTATPPAIVNSNLLAIDNPIYREILAEEEIGLGILEILDDILGIFE